jgi:very-short-patch-repair endonuclease
MTLTDWYLLAGFAVCLVLGIVGCDLILQASEDSTRDRELRESRATVVRFPNRASEATSEIPHSDREAS